MNIPLFGRGSENPLKQVITLGILGRDHCNPAGYCHTDEQLRQHFLAVGPSPSRSMPSLADS